MSATSTVRFFEGRTYQQVMGYIDNFCNNYPAWEITSVSHTIVPNGALSVACSIKYKGNTGQKTMIGEAIELPKADTEGPAK